MDPTTLMLLFVLGGALASLGLGGSDEEDATAAEDPPDPNEGLTIDFYTNLGTIQGKSLNDTVTVNYNVIHPTNATMVETLQGDDEITSIAHTGQISTGEGNDLVDVSGALSATSITGGEGADTLIGSEQRNVILAHGGNSILRHGPDGLLDDLDPDVIDGRGGDDELTFGSGDMATGGTGVDTFRVTNMNDIFDADQSAVITDWESGESLTILGDEAAATLTVEDRGDDAVVLWNGRVILTAENAAGVLQASDVAYQQVPPANPNVNFGVGDTGDNTFDDPGTALFSTFQGYEGNDIINMSGSVLSAATGGDGDDQITFSDGGTNEGYGGEGSDTLIGGNGTELLHSNGGHNWASAAGRDQWVDDGSPDVLDAGAGDDELHFGAGDTATGGAGADSFNVYGDDIIASGGDPAVLTDWESIDTIDIRYTGSGVVSVVDEGGDAVVYVDTTPILVAVGAGGLLIGV